MDVHNQEESKGGQPVARSTGIITSSLDVLAAPVKRAVASSTTKRAFVSSVVLSVLLCLSVAAAILAYAIFYYLYVPQIGFEKQVWLQYGHGKAPYGIIDLSDASLAIDQIYDVALNLVVPPTPRNLNLGARNFMVKLEIQTIDGNSVLQSARAASLVYTPPFIQYIQTLLRLPLFLFTRYRFSDQRLLIPLVSRQVLRTFSTRSISQALVTVGRDDAYAPDVCHTTGAGIGELQIYEAMLCFTAHLQGFRWFMYTYRTLSFLLFSGVFFTASSLSGVIIWGIFTLRASRRISVSTARSESQNEDTTVKGEESMRNVETQPMTGSQQHEAIDLLAEEESAARIRESRLREGRRMVEDDEESVLRHIPIMFSASENEDVKDEAVMVKRDSEDEEATTGSSSPPWQDLQDDPALRAVKKEEDLDSASTVGGSATSAGDTLSRRSFGQSVTAATSATGSASSVRQRR